MAAKIIRVLVVDDSAVLREFLCDLINAAEGLEVAGTAVDGEDALTKVAAIKPDIVTLDVLMPRMDGLEALDVILRTNPIPVIMVSAVTRRAADITLKALDCGALDYVAKPDSLKTANNIFCDEFIQKIRNMAGADVRRVLQVRKARAQRTAKKGISCDTAVSADAQAAKQFANACIAIGISTGGPPALTGLFGTLQPPLPAIAVVQHMPESFTSPFAERLNSISQLTVKEAKTGDEMIPNQVLIAPGGKHLHLRRQGSRVVVKIRNEAPVSGHKPSVDVLMNDVAAIYGDRCLGIVMTGMGYDGAEGCGRIRDAGGYVLGQDEVSSDVYGMNKVAFVRGNIDMQFPLEELPRLIAKKCKSLFLPESIECRF